MLFVAARDRAALLRGKPCKQSIVLAHSCGGAFEFVSAEDRDGRWKCAVLRWGTPCEHSVVLVHLCGGAFEFVSAEDGDVQSCGGDTL